jgi:outer membrane lipoprotein SlyB
MTNETSPGAVRPTPSSRTLWIVGGALGLVSLAAAGTIAIRSAMPAPADDAAETSHAVAAGRSVPRAGHKPGDRSVAAASKQAGATVCADCGVVESVRSVTRKGHGTGLGAVAGGVVGAAVGNQVGKGNGRSAMTVLGAVGGGFAGNEIEKRSRSVTVHEVRVRMDDGTLRTIEQSQPDAHAGERVIVQGSTLKPAPTANGKG